MQMGYTDSKEVCRYSKLQKRISDKLDLAHKHEIESKTQFETVTLISDDSMDNSPVKSPAPVRRATRSTRLAEDLRALAHV